MQFAIEICQALLPYYEKFERKYKWDDSRLLAEGIRLCENHVNLQAEVIHEYLEKIDLIIPDTDDFGDLEGSCALNASLAVFYTLKFLVDHDNKLILEVGMLMYETISFDIQHENESISDDELDDHPLLIAEMNRQLRNTKTV